MRTVPALVDTGYSMPMHTIASNFKRKKSMSVGIPIQYDHCPRLLAFKMGIEAYSDVFFMVQLPINFS